MADLRAATSLKFLYLSVSCALIRSGCKARGLRCIGAKPLQAAARTATALHALGPGGAVSVRLRRLHGIGA